MSESLLKKQNTLTSLTQSLNDSADYSDGEGEDNGVSNDFALPDTLAELEFGLHEQQEEIEFD